MDWIDSGFIQIDLFLHLSRQTGVIFSGASILMAIALLSVFFLFTVCFFPNLFGYEVCWESKVKQYAEETVRVFVAVPDTGAIFWPPEFTPPLPPVVLSVSL